MWFVFTIFFLSTVNNWFFSINFTDNIFMFDLFYEGFTETKYTWEVQEKSRNLCKNKKIDTFSHHSKFFTQLRSKITTRLISTDT